MREIALCNLQHFCLADIAGHTRLKGVSHYSLICILMKLMNDITTRCFAMINGFA
jgi:hypothetical protein